jgi:phosphosulfolactate synthase (CoM biosynthesis protein A)
MSVLFGLNAAEKLEVSQGAQTVIVADGDKDAYIRALQEAGREITGEVGSSSHDLDVGDEDDDAGEAAGDD